MNNQASAPAPRADEFWRGIGLPTVSDHPTGATLAPPSPEALLGGRCLLEALCDGDSTIARHLCSALEAQGRYDQSVGVALGATWALLVHMLGAEDAERLTAAEIDARILTSRDDTPTTPAPGGGHA